MIKQWELTSLIINAIFVKMILTFPRELIIENGNSAWIQVVYNTLCAVLIFVITASVYKGKKNIIELSQKLGKAPLRIIIGLLTFLILMSNFTPIIRIYPETVKIILLQDTEMRTIIIVFAATAAIGAYFGIESIAKMNYIFIPMGAFILFIFMLLLIPYYKIENITPIFGKGFNNLFLKGFNSLSIYSDLILLNIFLPLLEDEKIMKKSGLRAIFIAGAASITVMTAYCLTYQNPVSEEFILPVYQLLRIIHISSFFSRFEAFFLFIWSTMVFLYTSFYIYALCYVLQQTFNFKFNKPLIIPVIIISTLVMFIPQSLANILNYTKKINTIAYPFAFLLPIIYGIYSRKESRNEIN